jgi:hypothetical protein
MQDCGVPQSSRSFISSAAAPEPFCLRSLDLLETWFGIIDPGVIPAGRFVTVARRMTPTGEPAPHGAGFPRNRAGPELAVTI